MDACSHFLEQIWNEKNFADNKVSFIISANFLSATVEDTL